MKKPSLDLSKVLPEHSDIHKRLDNWAYWSQQRPHYSACFMFLWAKSNAKHWHPPQTPRVVDRLDAMKMERAIVRLPLLNRRAIVWAYGVRFTAFSRLASIREMCRALHTSKAALDRAIHDARQMLKNTLRA